LGYISLNMIQLFKKILYLFSDREKLQIGLIFLLMLGGAGLETLGVGLIPPFVALLGNPDIIQKQPILSWLFVKLGANSNQTFLLWLSII
jgi:ATP-binding cassette, subfamily B, bacterial PglK